MSSPAVNAQQEPTMEEILASIRKIISEDQPEAANAVQPTPLRAVEPVPAPAPEPEAAPEAEVLELTDELPAEEPPAPPPENDDEIAFAPENVERKAPSSGEDDLISESTRSAVGQAFASMTNEPSVPAPLAPQGGALDALFVHAIKSSFEPALSEWIENNREEILDAMKPLIRGWMDEHLPLLVETVVAREIARASAGNGRRR